VLLNLRLASSLETRLIIAEHVLPLACVDEGVQRVKDERQMAEGEKWTLDSVLSHVEGADSTLAPAPLLPNLGKASANPYWMDIMVRQRSAVFCTMEFLTLRHRWTLLSMAKNARYVSFVHWLYRLAGASYV
jgi:hypothetical protein